MSQVAEATIEINQPVGIVYSFVTDLNNMVFFWDRIKSVEKVSGDGGVGTIYNLISRTLLGGKKIFPIEITKLMAHENFEYRDADSSSQVLTGYSLIDLDKKTKVTLYRKTNLGGLANLVTLSPLTSRDVKREFEEILLGLKMYLEDVPEVPKVTEETA